jgi:hypothetical protein
MCQRPRDPTGALCFREWRFLCLTGTFTGPSDQGSIPVRLGIAVRIAFVGALATVTMGLGCGEGPLDGTGPAVSSKSLNGTWSGSILDLNMSLTLTESSGTVSGSGTMVQTGQSFSLSVAGTSDNGTFSLTVSEASHDPFTYSGTVQTSPSPTRMVGVGNGSGLTNQPITLTKQ